LASVCDNLENFLYPPAAGLNVCSSHLCVYAIQSAKQKASHEGGRNVCRSHLCVFAIQTAKEKASYEGGRVFACVCVWMFSSVHVCENSHMHTYIYIYAYSCFYRFTYIYIYLCGKERVSNSSLCDTLQHIFGVPERF